MVPRAGTQSPGLHPRHCMTPMRYPWCPLEIFMGPLGVGKKGIGGRRKEEIKNKGGVKRGEGGEEEKGREPLGALS